MQGTQITNTTFFNKYRIVIVSVCVGIVFASIMLSVWFNVKLKLDQSNYNLVATEGDIITQKILSEIELFEAENNNPVSQADLQELIQRILDDHPELYTEISDSNEDTPTRDRLWVK